MDGISSLVKPVLESNSKNEALTNILHACIDQKSFSQNESEIPRIIGVINASLNASISRFDGLILLRALLPQCPQDFLCKHGSSWTQFCLKGMTVAQTAPTSFTVFRTLVQLSASIPELAKYVSSSGIPNLAEQIHQGIPPQANLNALECLELCMTVFNGPCGPHKKVMERFILSFMDYAGPGQRDISWQAARCFALLPQVGGGGTGGAVYKAAWVAQQRSLLRSIHVILDSLYSGSNEIEVSSTGGKLEGTIPISLEPIHCADPVPRSQRLSIRLCALSSCLQAMMIMGYPVTRSVAASAIMNLICRGLAVNGMSASLRQTTHGLALAAYLPKVHYALLRLLESVIILSETNMLPFARLICKLVAQTLKWTHVAECSYGSVRPFSFLRIQAYEVYKLWCGTAKLGSCVADNAHLISDLALLDIYSEKDSVSLTVGSKGSKKKRSASAANRINSSQVEMRDGTANLQVCIAALQAMTALVMAGSFKLQSSLHKTLQETVIGVLLQMNNTHIPIPYSQPDARLELYRLLLQLVLDAHSVWPAPTHIALTLFSQGLHDSDVQISMFCNLAQSCLEKIIHPTFSSLSLVSDIKDLEDSYKDQMEKGTSLLSSTPRVQHDIINSDNVTAEAESETISNTKQRLSTRSNAAPSGTVSPGISPLLKEVDESGKSKSPPSQLPLKSSITSAKKESLTDSNSLSKNLEQSEVADKTLSDVMDDTSDILCSPMQTRSGKILKSPSSSGEKERGASKNSSQISGGSGDNHDQIDLTGSGDEDIVESICEIDLVDSDDDKISICSQTTVSIPVTRSKERTVRIEKESLAECDTKSAEQDDRDIHSAVTQTEKDVGKIVVGIENAETTTPSAPEGSKPLSGQRKRSAEIAVPSPKKQKVTDGTNIEKTTEQERAEAAKETEKQDSNEFGFDDDLDEEAMLSTFVNVTLEDERSGDQ